jgi:hypothetical protein
MRRRLVAKRRLGEYTLSASGGRQNSAQDQAHQRQRDDPEPEPRLVAHGVSVRRGPARLRVACVGGTGMGWRAGAGGATPLARMASTGRPGSRAGCTSRRGVPSPDRPHPFGASSSSCIVVMPRKRISSSAERAPARGRRRCRRRYGGEELVSDRPGGAAGPRPSPPTPSADRGSARPRARDARTLSAGR